MALFEELHTAGPDDRPRHPRTRHRRARPAPGPPEGRTRRARLPDREDQLMRIQFPARRASWPLAACKKPAPTPVYQARAGGEARHRRLGPGRGRHPARHHGRGQVQGLGRDPRDHGRDRPAGAARHAAGPGRPAAARGTRSTRPRPSSTWRRRSWTTPRPRWSRRTSCSSPSRSRSRSTRRRMLDYANAKAEVVDAQVAWRTPRSALEDTDVRAPITGTIIEKDVERGQVISSPTSDVGGGTVLLKMADLNLVQVRTLVDETDIGKIQAGPARHGDGGRLPQPAVRGRGAQDRAAGRDAAERHDVPGAGPDRQPRRAAPARHERRGGDPRRPARQRARGAERGAPHPAGRRLGGRCARPRPWSRCNAQLAASASRRQRAGETPRPRARYRSVPALVHRPARHSAGEAPAGNTMTTPDGRVITLPDGRHRGAGAGHLRQVPMSGEQLTPAERALLQQVCGG